jgi:hypothetical protein
MARHFDQHDDEWPRAMTQATRVPVGPLMHDLHGSFFA